jgi:hypothetical protein
MAESNVEAYTTAAADPEELRMLLKGAAARIYVDPASHVAGLTSEMPEADRLVVADSTVHNALVVNFAEGLRDSAEGWIDDVLAFCSPWGFDVGDIEVPVYLWHGGKDVFSPEAHTQWLANRIPSALARYEPDRAHFGALEVVPDVLLWLSGQTDKISTGRTDPVSARWTRTVPPGRRNPVLAGMLTKPRSLNELAARRVCHRVPKILPDGCPDDLTKHIVKVVQARDAFCSHRGGRRSLG